MNNPFLVGPLIERLAPRERAPLRVPVRRPDDHLVFDLMVENLRIRPDGDGAARLVRDTPGQRSFLIIEFPPQSFGEEAFLAVKSDLDATGVGNELPPSRNGQPVISGVTATKQANNDLKPTAEPLLGRLPARVRMAGPSRIALRMPDALEDLPFTLAAVLAALRDWPMNLAIGARPDQVDFDPLWLRADVAERLSAAILANLPDNEAVDAKRRLEEGTQRIADLAAGGLNNGQPAPVAFEALRREADRLFTRHPQLRRGDLHTATLAALAAGSAGRLAATAAAAGISDRAAGIGAMPYLPLLADTPHQPGSSVTALELPYRLLMTPIGTPAGTPQWQHRDEPVTARGRTELWHTRLSGAEGAASRLRFLWSPDLDATGDGAGPFRMSLDRQDRDFLVKLTADWRQKRAGSGRTYLPPSAEAKRLHLSALGALLEAGGDWEPRPEGVDLEQWRHLATLGRDQVVRVVYAGFLMPFGHAASLVKVTERRFESADPARPGDRLALLRQRFFLIVRERIRRYDGSTHEHGARNLPFTEVEILTGDTPDLTDPAAGPSRIDETGGAVYGPVVVGGKTITVSPRMVFWPRLQGSGDFRFEVAGTDRNGERRVFTLPMLFVSEVANRARAAEIRAGYDAAPPARRETDLGGGSVRFDAGGGVSSLPTEWMRFVVGGVVGAEDLAPQFHPEMDQARVRVPAIQTLLGRADGIEMRYPDVVVENKANPGEIYLEVAGPALDLKFGGGGQGQTDALGGIGAPQMAIYGLSKRSGPVSAKPGLSTATALANGIANRFSVADFFPLDATLIGGIALGEIINPVVAALDAADAPRLLETPFPDRVEAGFEWTTVVTRPDALKLMVPRADGVNPTPLRLSGRTVVPFDPARPPTREAHAVLENFKLNLFGCIILWFRRLSFDALPGRKPAVAVALAEGDDAVRFGGPLEFVNDLRAFIPSGGFGDGAGLSVTPSGIAAGYSLGLPAIEVGIFSLSNVSLGAGFSLPFDNRPVTVRFNFAERQCPFSLTVSLLGGGGFFAIGVGAKGVQEIEAALEFGAAIALNLVVASGTVEIKAGVYFHWQSEGRVKLAGYVRIHGELTVVAIFSASLTFNLQLAYEKDGGGSVVYGEAELIVEVEVLLLSFDVTVRCRREFGGGKADPRFLDLMPDQTVWDDYCSAFALEAA
ncbi:hypothetical protein [Synechococcus sp. CCAP 1479/9]|uniref:hypothetical protein n=1 Tax=Synechococcus sp. CCAP 1479/9 TaxID=1221593 RepID=UPI001C236C3D|nr:hypothetical protein [Synechococcus sp. CCAP 1479/9]